MLRWVPKSGERHAYDKCKARIAVEACRVGRHRSDADGWPCRLQRPRLGASARSRCGRQRLPLGPGDQIRIITFGEQQLTGEFRVDAAGEIALPLVGGVHAAGLTPKQLEGSVAQALTRSKLYRNPSVSVEVIAYRPIFILGEVARPGQYPYQPAMTVVTAAAVAGGFTYRAVTNRFSIVRTSNKTPETSEGGAVRETLVQPGDVITVFERVF